MKFALRSTPIVLLSAMAGVAVGGPLEDGQAAYDRKDYATAVLLWRPLADQGNAAAQADIGYIYETGRGTKRDQVAAIDWYRKAADQG